MSGYGDRGNDEYIEGNRGDANYIDSNPTRGEKAGSGGMMDKLKGAMGMGSSGNKDRSDYDSSNTDSYGSGNTRDKYSSGDNTTSDSYGSGNTRTGRDDSDTYGSSGRGNTDTYGSSGRGNTDTYGSNPTSGSDTYGSTGNTSSSFGVGNNTTSFTDQPIGSTKGGDAFANKAYDGQRTIDDFTSTTGTGASNLTSRTGQDSYGQRDTDTYGSGRDNTNTYGSTGSDNTGAYGSTGRDTYGSTGNDMSDTYGSSGDNYGEGKHHHHEKKEGMMDKMADKMGMRTNADAYDQDRNVRDVDPKNY